MITISLLSLGLVILLASVTVLSVIATRHPALMPATVNPFGPSIGVDAADTLNVGSHAETTLAGDRQAAELNRLSDVEELLDTLEATHHRAELEIAGNDRFTVRWR
jgi:hypothetical protein